MRQAHERRAESLPAVSYLQCRSSASTLSQLPEYILTVPGQTQSKSSKLITKAQVLSSYRHRTPSQQVRFCTPPYTRINV
jgi:hypothetical protein